MSAIRCRRKWLQVKFKTCNVYLSPDMAHQLWPIRSKNMPGKELLCFLRTDIEKTAEQERLEASGNGDYLDWSTLFNGVEHKSIRVFNKMLQKGSGKLPLSKFWGKYTDYLVNKAVNRFSDYRTVQTSRLTVIFCPVSWISPTSCSITRTARTPATTAHGPEA